MEKIKEQVEEGVPLKEVFAKIRRFIAYLKRKWRLLFVCTFIGALVGLACSFFVKAKYTAVSSFVLDEGDKGGMLGQYAGLASLAGINLGDGGGIFKGDNILQLYKSRAMIEKALLSEVEINGKRQKLIDRYIDVNALAHKWKTSDNMDNINFNANPESFNRKQDSIITDIAEAFNKQNLEVSKPDKKLSIINVKFTAKDELFAKAFTDELVKTVNDFYIQTKTRKSAQNIGILQRQADSVRRELNTSLGGVAAALDAAPNANPALISLRVPSQRRQVDVQANTAIYGEVVKNLEISKISLMQQTPLIQFIDQPVLPLTVTKIGKIKGLIIGGFVGFLFTIFLLLVKKIFGALS